MFQVTNYRPHKHSEARTNAEGINFSRSGSYGHNVLSDAGSGVKVRQRRELYVLSESGDSSDDIGYFQAAPAVKNTRDAQHHYGSKITSNDFVGRQKDTSGGDVADNWEILLQREKSKNQYLKLKKENELLINNDVQPERPVVGRRGVEIFSGSAVHAAQPGSTNLDSLRSMTGLAQQVEEQMFGLTGTGRVAPDSGGRVNAGTLRSGAEEVNLASIRRKLVWPQSYLKYSHARMQYKFLDLPSFGLYVAGEIGCLSHEDMSQQDRMGRWGLMQSAAYFCERYPWFAVSDYLFNVFLEVERGLRSFSDSHIDIESNILFSMKERSSEPVHSTSRPAVQSQKPDQRNWWCADYQRDQCNFQGSHDIIIRGVKEGLIISVQPVGKGEKWRDHIQKVVMSVLIEIRARMVRENDYM